MQFPTLLALLLVAAAHADYDEHFTRLKVIPLVAAAYASDVNKCLTKTFPYIQVGCL